MVKEIIKIIVIITVFKPLDIILLVLQKLC